MPTPASALTLASVPRPSPGVIAQNAQEELVLVLPQEGKVKVLNPVGAFVWKHIDGKRTLQSIADMLCREYEVSPSQAAQDVLDFAASLLERGLIAV